MRGSQHPTFNNESPAPFQRPCLHYLKGRIPVQTCTNDYLCGNCEFDQYFYDEYTVHAVVRPVDLVEVKGFRIPQGYYLHHGHAWVKMEEGSSVRVGIDDFALRLLGPLDRHRGTSHGQGGEAGRSLMWRSDEGEHGKSALSCERGDHRRQSKTEGSGTLPIRSPYSDGWVMTIQAENVRKDLKEPDDRPGNRRSSSSTKWITLHHLIEEVSAPWHSRRRDHLGTGPVRAMPQLWAGKG